MTASPVSRTELRELIADVLDIETASLTDEVRFVEDLHVDSLIALELAVTLERRYQIKVEEAEVVGLHKLPDVYHLLDTKLASA
ncbi:phosphopantetheine-binding protein [Streptomyces sp. N2-109]|uniref:Phosphopantetheine-binding protein n=1 Tax=Streptomyces gossypii TaxID=2883101 RepID=A0ABT2JPG7_9ACTN|nr:phosphopantetheine-binding protein [Streptomyces gossypii]MCT2589608.1 phosphopantetheine-binding protein [Streptomyces gossypii]